ncbi:cytochrome ubiquinol oxidase subunit I [Desulfovibrio sulfodismutans]|uniref:Cytochrome ubiquinol oxidase subunit I n=1 Tax=Desulfolutivibrio sulfodismutans TaxID=63561 RepID=A0A7K3NKZ7_9BACT|nr:cytochrome ubiquinol oxidase subunit I [Desulfolutivibrio sulfodismutans]NDY56445.1 cytochrome ubiquinol oxidase subunit I [Desulfolutivibrio sulfodismutans]QLA13795.1 cytochrome ubiquinol oxidase subunit I [Desulfolutivibrio sulfodismutans DSM 3696]
MDTLMLSRLQFAFATFIHFIFVPLTLGLSILVAYMETKYVRTGDETYKKMAKFWGKLFLINFALGVVTGITLEFQFGTNWSRYSTYVGDIFGSLLAIEATAAFFLESTFVAVWVFGWKKLSKTFHAVCIWIVAFAANLSALWIILANGFMQNPMGYVIRNGRAELDSFYAVITNGFAWSQYIHTVVGSYVLAGFFVMGVSAWHLLRKQNIDFFGKSFRIGLGFALVASLVVAIQGHSHGNEVARIQPAKLAAMEAHWETGTHVPMYLLSIPDEKNEKNSVEAFGIPSMLSILAFNDPAAEVKGLKAFAPEDRPPVTLTFLSFRLMVGFGTLMILLTVWGFLKRNNLLDNPRYLQFMVWAIPVPYLALQAGWAVAEVGRQPWIVHGLMRTKDAVSPIATSQVAVSLAAFVVVYLLLASLDIYLLAKYARKVPA